MAQAYDDVNMGTDEMEVEQYVTANQAIKILKSTRETMRRWLSTGVLPWVPNPGDKRKKMIPLREVQRLKLLREEGKMLVPKAMRQPAA